MKRRIWIIAFVLFMAITAMIQYRPADEQVFSSSNYIQTENDNTSVDSINTLNSLTEMKVVENYRLIQEPGNVRCSLASVSSKSTVLLMYIFIVFSAIFYLSRNYLLIHDDKHIIYLRYYISYMQNKDGRKRA